MERLLPQGQRRAQARVFTMPSQVGARPEKGTGGRVSTRDRRTGTLRRAGCASRTFGYGPTTCFSQARSLTRADKIATRCKMAASTDRRRLALFMERAGLSGVGAAYHG